MAVTVTDLRNGGTIIDGADAITGWSSGESFSLFTTEPDPIESTGHLGVIVSKTSAYLEHTHGSTIDGSGAGILVYLWVLNRGAPLATASGGLGVAIGDGTNLIGYWLAGGDNKGFTHDTGQPYYQCLLLDTSLLPAGFTEWIGSAASLSLNALTQFGLHVDNGAAKAVGGVANFFVDILRVGNEGLEITGGTTSDRGTFAEIAADDADTADGKAYGIIRAVSAGVYGVQGPLTFGDTAGASDVYFDDDGSTVIFENRFIADDKYFFAVEGASGQTNVWNMSNGTIKSAGPQVLTTFNGGDIDTLTIDNVAFDSLGKSITFSNAADASGHSVTGSSFFQCGQVDPGDVTFTNNSFLDSNTPTDGAMLLDGDGTANMSGLSFTTTLGYGYTGAAIYITATGTYTFTNFSFTGYGSTGSGTAAVYNASGGEVTIQVSGGTAPTYDNGPGATTFIISTKTIDYHVENADGADVENAQVYIQKQTPTAFFAGDEYNQEGQTFLVVDQTIDADLPVSGRVTVYDKSENATLTYRYNNIDVDRLEFLAEVTGTADAEGTGTQLFDTGAFGSVEEGDAIRNTTDGSWAVVDQKVSANELFTSQLRGGTDNTWASGDEWSINTLATTLETNVDTVDIPFVNAQTDSSGDITQVSFNFQSSVDVNIRVRSNEGSTKYVPFLTAAQIVGNFTGTAVIQEDTVAT